MIRVAGATHFQRWKIPLLRFFGPFRAIYSDFKYKLLRFGVPILGPNDGFLAAPCAKSVAIATMIL